MDGAAFDRIATSVAKIATRRLVVAAALALAGMAVAGDGAGASRRPTCRAANAGCTRNGQCCSGICELGRGVHRHRRNRCRCVADCAGKTCGNDGCGGVCGECSAFESCEAGSCIDPCASCGVEEICMSGECVNPCSNGGGGCWVCADFDIATAGENCPPATQFGGACKDDEACYAQNALCGTTVDGVRIDCMCAVAIYEDGLLQATFPYGQCVTHPADGSACPA